MFADIRLKIIKKLIYTYNTTLESRLIHITNISKNTPSNNLTSNTTPFKNKSTTIFQTTSVSNISQIITDCLIIHLNREYFTFIVIRHMVPWHNKIFMAIASDLSFMLFLIPYEEMVRFSSCETLCCAVSFLCSLSYVG